MATDNLAMFDLIYFIETKGCQMAKTTALVTCV